MTERTRRAASLALSILTVSLLLASCRDSSCEESRRSVVVPDDPEVLQGIWQGRVEKYPNVEATTPLRLELAATYVDDGTYSLSGTFALGSEDPQPLNGIVGGGCRERYVPASANSDYLEPARQPLPGTIMEAEVLDGDGMLLWKLESSWFLLSRREEGVIGVWLSDERKSYLAELQRLEHE